MPPWSSSAKSIPSWASGCRHRFGDTSGCCNAANQEVCVRSTACLCGVPRSTDGEKPLYSAEQLKGLLKAPAEDMAVAVAWWGSECTCEVDSLEFPEKGARKPCARNAFEPISLT